MLDALASDLPNARVLDLFAGTGALGLEAISRGARSADFVEFRPSSLHALRANVAALRVREGQYGWQQLQRWQDAATNGAFSVNGTVYVDNDETSNRVHVGV